MYLKNPKVGDIGRKEREDKERQAERQRNRERESEVTCTEWKLKTE